MARFDLTSYGINAVLTPTFDFNTLHEHSFLGGTHNYDKQFKLHDFVLSGIQYDILEKMGSGTYGTTYKTQSRSDGKIYAIKHIHGELHKKRDLIVFAKESIIQILLAEESKAQKNGPYVPMLYEIAYNPYKLNGYIRSELMRNTLQNLSSGSSEVANDAIIPDALSQIATMLEFLGKQLRFNHRDFKGDNVMYVRDGDKRIYKLIDFGFSCLTWNGLKINGGDYFSASTRCYIKHRDLSQLMYYIVKHLPISRQLEKELNTLLQANVKSKECVLTKSCGVHSWLNTYNLLNRDNVTVPRGNPRNVHDAMDAFRHPKPRILPPVLPPFIHVAEPIHICPPGKLLNPKTDRCVQENGNVAKQLPKMDAPEDCPPGKIRNPKTRRCVKVDGWAGKRVVEKLHIPENALKPLEIQKPDCPPGKILNPKTRRCVKIDGWAGKQVQRAFPPLPMSEPSASQSEKGLLKGTRKFLKGLFGKTRKN